ncbi:unnamed protein product, partial [Staurois parvus]
MMSTSDILLTTIHMITDWPISDHMIRTSHRGPVQRLVFTVGTGSSGQRIAVLYTPRERAQAGSKEAVY